MKLFAGLALVSLVACGFHSQQMSADSPALRPVFTEWQTAIVDGDFNYVFERTSATMKARWLYGIFTPVETKDGLEFNPVAKDTIKKLPPMIATDFENWLRVNRLNQSAEMSVGPLPSNIMSNPWLRETLKAHFDKQQPLLKHEFQGKEFREGYIDGDAATILVKNIRGDSEMYEVVREDDTWKMNHWKPSPPKK